MRPYERPWACWELWKRWTDPCRSASSRSCDECHWRATVCGESQAKAGKSAMGKILFGVHTGPQNCSLEDLRAVWRLADRSGFHWISIWDHFYPAMLNPG